MIALTQTVQYGRGPRYADVPAVDATSSRMQLHAVSNDFTGHLERSLAWVEIDGEFMGVHEASTVFTMFTRFDRRATAR